MTRLSGIKALKIVICAHETSAILAVEKIRMERYLRFVNISTLALRSVKCCLTVGCILGS